MEERQHRNLDIHRRWVPEPSVLVPESVLVLVPVGFLHVAPFFARLNTTLPESYHQNVF